MIEFVNLQKEEACGDNWLVKELNKRAIKIADSQGVATAPYGYRIDTSGVWLSMIV